MPPLRACILGPQRGRGRPCGARNGYMGAVRSLFAWQLVLECGLAAGGGLPAALGDELESTLTQVVVIGSRIPVARNAVALEVRAGVDNVSDRAL